MTHSRKITAALFALLFLYVEASQAGLVRNTGRSTLSRNDGQSLWYVGSDALVKDASGALIRDANFNLAGAIEDPRIGGGGAVRGVGFGGRGLTAVPGGGDCFTQDFQAAAFTSVADAEAAAATYDASNTPCEWVFEEDQPLELFGSFGLFFDLPGEIDYQVTWNIEGPGVDLNLVGRVNTDGDVIVGTDGDDITFFKGGGVFLDGVGSPEDLGLAAGTDYSVFVDVFLDAPGVFFLESSAPGSPRQFKWKEQCGIPNPDFPASGDPGSIPFDVCGWNTYEEGSGFDNAGSGRTSFSSLFTLDSNFPAETLRIIASTTVDDDPSGVVSTPSTILYSLFGLLLFRRGRRNAQP